MGTSGLQPMGTNDCQERKKPPSPGQTELGGISRSIMHRANGAM